MDDRPRATTNRYECAEKDGEKQATYADHVCHEHRKHEGRQIGVEWSYKVVLGTGMRWLRSKSKDFQLRYGTESGSGNLVNMSLEGGNKR